MEGGSKKGNLAFVFVAGPIGGAIGGCLALAYIILTVLFMTIDLGIPREEVERIGLWILILSIIPVGLIIAGIPSVVLGLLTGILLGYILGRWKRHMTLFQSIMLGAGISLVGASVVHGVTWLAVGHLAGVAGMETGAFIFLEPPFSSLRGYLFWLGLPSLIYIVTNSCYSCVLYWLEGHG